MNVEISVICLWLAIILPYAALIYFNNQQEVNSLIIYLHVSVKFARQVFEIIKPKIKKHPLCVNKYLATNKCRYKIKHKM